MLSVGMEQLPRVRFEHHRAGKMRGAMPCRGFGALAGTCEQRLMAAVHAVEVANRERCAAQLLGDMIETVEDMHGRAIRGRTRGFRTTSSISET